MTNIDLFTRLGEPRRMHRLTEYDFFHPDLGAELNRIATRSAGRLHAAISMVSIMLDSAQIMIGHHGLPDMGEMEGIPAEWALCSTTVLAGNPYCLADRLDDPRHAGNPVLAMAGLRSYAGVPLSDDDGHVLGAHCVLDTSPRDYSGDDIAVLAEGATEIMEILGRYRIA